MRIHSSIPKLFLVPSHGLYGKAESGEAQETHYLMKKFSQGKFQHTVTRNAANDSHSS